MPPRTLLPWKRTCGGRILNSPASCRPATSGAGSELVADLALVAETPTGSGIEILQVADRTKIWLADRRRWGVALVLATGSDRHLEELRSLAARRGLRLDEHGLFRGDNLIECTEEEDVYAALGLPFIAPELREGRGEIALATDRRLPRLVTNEDIRGLLHCHTDFSDGANTLEEMAEATRARGFHYFGVADHSRTAAYAGGLSIDRVIEQHRLVDVLNRRYSGTFRILKGIESDILVDGALDYPDEILATFDFVVASVHSRFGLDPAAQTERIIRAVSNPFTTILGHMTGRLLRRREGYRIDIERVLEACAAHGVAVEINANPHRLDLDWRWHRRALELGCLFSINPDAHDTDELDLTSWGVLQARKGGVPPDRVLNCLGLDSWRRSLRRAGRAVQSLPTKKTRPSFEGSARQCETYDRPGSSSAPHRWPSRAFRTAVRNGRATAARLGEEPGDAARGQFYFRPAGP